MIFSFGAKIIGGKFTFDEPKQFMNFVRLNDGKRITVSLSEEKRPHKPRSLQQSAYYWAVPVQILADELGYTKDEMHEALKWEFLRYQRHVVREKRVGDRVKKIDKILWCSRSTTELSTKEFEDFLGRVRTWASVELGCYIPLPREVDFSFELN